MSKWQFFENDEAVALGMYRRFKRAPLWKKGMILDSFIRWMIA